MFRPVTERGWRQFGTPLGGMALALLAIALLPIGKATMQPHAQEARLAPSPAAPSTRADVVAALRRVALPAGTGRFVPSSATGDGAKPNLALAAGDLQPASPFRFHGNATDRERAVQCLALTAWYEAGDDAIAQRSVIQVVLNRVAHPAFPKSVCGVVFQGSERRTGCQFTFTCDGSMIRRQPSVAALARARALALSALAGAVDTSVLQATHYHADYVQPWWAPSLERLGIVGRHIFYRWGGARGALAGRPKLAGEADPYALMATRPLDSDAGTALAPSLPGEDPEALAPPLETLPTLADPLPPRVALPPPSSTQFLEVNPGSASGRWAMSALERCGGKASCQVVGYGDADQLVRNQWAPARGRERPLFLFIRDASTGMELALWDCDRVQRPAADQCLPQAGAQLNRLMRER